MLIDIIYTVVLLLGATFFYYGITQFQKSYTLKKEGVRVKATVVDFQTHSNKGSTMYTPVFNFKTPQGKEMTVVSAVSSHPKPYEINEKVMLIYEKNKPENAKPIGFGVFTSSPSYCSHLLFLFSLSVWGDFSFNGITYK